MPTNQADVITSNNANEMALDTLNGNDTVNLLVGSTITTNATALMFGGGDVQNSTANISGQISTTGNAHYGISDASNGLSVNIGVNGVILTQGVASHGIFVSGANADANIINDGLIATIGSSSVGIFVMRNLNLKNDGVIESFGDNSIAILTAGPNSTINNNGLIFGGGANTGAIYCDQDAMIRNSGTSAIPIVGIITTGNKGHAILSNGNLLSVVNDSLIQTSGSQAGCIVGGAVNNTQVEVQNLEHGVIQTLNAMDADAITAMGRMIVSNAGLIATQGFGSEALHAFGPLDLQNLTSGTIQTTGNSSDAILALGNTTILNQGLIQATGTGSRAIEVIGGSARIDNSGTIAVTDAVSAINLNNNQNDVFINRAGGSVLSPGKYSIQMGGGDDLAQIYAGSHVDGIMHGGTQVTADTLEFKFAVACKDLINQWQNLPSAGSITYWGETYSWEDFEKIIVDVKSLELCAQTPNQAAVGHALECFDGKPSEKLANFLTNIASYDCKDIPEILNQLSPQRYEIMSKIAFDNNDFMIEQLNGRSSVLRQGASGIDTHQLTLMDHSLDPAFARLTPLLAGTTMEDNSRHMSDSSSPRVRTRTTAENDNRFGLFLSGNAIMADGDGTRDIYDYNWDTYSVLAGADYKLLPGLAIGVMGGYSHTDADMDSFGSKLDAETYTIGTYANAWWNHWYANAAFTYSWNDYDMNRRIPFIDKTLHADTDGQQFGLALSGGYDFTFGQLSVGPIAGIRYVNWWRDSFKESGSGVESLHVDDDSADSLRTQLGGRAAYTFKLSDSCSLTPELRASWNHEFLDNSRSIRADFNESILDSFNVQSTKPERDWADVGVSLRAKLGERVSLFVDYDAQPGRSDFFAHAVQGGVRFEF